MNLMQLFAAIIMLTVLGFTAAALGGAQADFRDDIIAGLDGTTIRNESIVGVGNSSYVALANSPTAVEVTCVDIYNGTEECNLANFTCDQDGMRITAGLANQSCHHNSSFLVVYTFKNATSIYNISSNGLSGINNASDYFDNIGTFLGIAALLGVILILFAQIGTRKQ